MDETMTKEEKMRALIRQELDRSFVPNLNKQLYSCAPYVKKLKAHPKFLEAFIEEVVSVQLPFYMMASNEVADAAYTFFTSPLGKQWCDLAGAFNDKLPLIVPPLVLDMV